MSRRGLALAGKYEGQVPLQPPETTLSAPLNTWCFSMVPRTCVKALVDNLGINDVTGELMGVLSAAQDTGQAELDFAFNTFVEPFLPSMVKIDAVRGRIFHCLALWQQLARGAGRGDKLAPFRQALSSPARFGRAAAVPPPEAAAGATDAEIAAATADWSCPACTFLNPSTEPKCVVCGTARPGGGGSGGDGGGGSGGDKGLAMPKLAVAPCLTAISVSFQPTSAALPPGYLADDGTGFRQRGLVPWGAVSEAGRVFPPKFFEYGWTQKGRGAKPLSGLVRDRSKGHAPGRGGPRKQVQGNPTEVQKTIVHVPVGNEWGITVPVGATFDVVVTVSERMTTGSVEWVGGGGRAREPRREAGWGLRGLSFCGVRERKRGRWG